MPALRPLLPDRVHYPETLEQVAQVVKELLRKAGKPLAAKQGPVDGTHSVQYATTALEQSGHKVIKVTIDVTQAERWTIESMMDQFKMPPAERAKLCSDFQLKPTDKVLANYDIHMDVTPHPKNP